MKTLTLTNNMILCSIICLFLCLFFHALAFYQASRFQIDKSFSNNNFYSFYSFYPAKRFFNFIFSSLTPSLDNIPLPSPVGEGSGVRLKKEGPLSLSRAPLRLYVMKNLRELKLHSLLFVLLNIFVIEKA